MKDTMFKLSIVNNSFQLHPDETYKMKIIGVQLNFFPIHFLIMSYYDIIFSTREKDMRIVKFFDEERNALKAT